MKAFLIFLSYFVMLAACSTPHHQNIDALAPGMDKTTILDSLGSPDHSRFKNGQDEWIYIYYKDDLKKAKKLWLKNDQLLKIEDYDLEHQAPVSEVELKNVKINDQEASKIKKALSEKKQLEKEESEFKDLD